MLNSMTTTFQPWSAHLDTGSEAMTGTSGRSDLGGRYGQTQNEDGGEDLLIKWS